MFKLLSPLSAKEPSTSRLLLGPKLDGGGLGCPSDYIQVDAAVAAAELVVLAELLVYRRLLEALRALPIPTPGRVAEFGPARDQACPSGGEWQICCYGVLNGKEAWPAPRRRPADHPF
jgi:hypothetical protein